jgi:uncharacterized protein (DUF1697 family)
MDTYIALLRGINVSGQKKIIMAEFRDLLEVNGFSKVKTYIQSGNVVFDYESVDQNLIASKMEQIIVSHYGFEVPILVLTPEELKQALTSNPFISDPEIDETNTYFTFLKNQPSLKGITDFEACSYPNETFILREKVVYYYCTIGFGKAKFTNKLMEKKLGTRATTRNYKTTLKLISMTQD